jgi:signal transduction histidine kinase
VSNLSHDLRSPLTATTACLETLDARWTARGETDDQTAADIADDRRLIEIALRNTRNAARLVQSLGDLSKLDEPEFKLHLEVVDAGELLDDICIRFADRAAKLGVALLADHSGGAAPARLDVELFERAVANLVDNALKFCVSGDSVELAAKPSDGRLLVSVKDDGPGIAAADLPHLFDRFYQSRQSVAPATGEGGKGLGLAIVKRIVELHNGAVSVVSRPGAGTEVVLSVPGNP